jgi:hypothetical protein
MTGHLLDLVHDELTLYVAFPSGEAADATALWIAATHAQPCWEHAPRLAVISPEKRCGKSRLLDIIAATARSTLMTVNISPAALVRSIGADPPTLLLDEADTVFGRKASDNHEDLRGILNAGHQRRRPYIRWDAQARQLEECATFAMAALASIGDLPDTIMDRAVVIRMRRRAANEKVSPYRTRRDEPPLHQVRGSLSLWLADNLDELAEAVPDLPVDDREADTWEPLVAVADLAGGDWPARARTACMVLTAEDPAEISVGTRLLADLRAVFNGHDAMHGHDILARLYDIEDGPWVGWYGRGLNARDLAVLLRPYGVGPCNVKLSGTNRNGYRRDQLFEAWNRYLSPTSPTAAT